MIARAMQRIRTIARVMIGMKQTMHSPISGDTRQIKRNRKGIYIL